MDLGWALDSITCVLVREWFETQRKGLGEDGSRPKQRDVMQT